MQKFEDILSNYANLFPSTAAVNASGPSATDGTEWIKGLVDEWFGFDQALVNHANITPDGNTDIGTTTGVAGTSSDCERLVAIQKICGAPGEVVAWMGANADPSLGAGGDARLLPCVGQCITIADYPDLVSACYVGDANNGTAGAFYKVDDAAWPASGAKDIAGLYLYLPDLRGFFLRGLDTGAIIDPDGASRSIGDVQADMVVDHRHDGLYANGGLAKFASGGGGNNVAAGTDDEAPLITGGSSDMVTGNVANYSVIGAAVTHGAETRPSNSACHWCIRY